MKQKIDNVSEKTDRQIALEILEKMQKPKLEKLKNTELNSITAKKLHTEIQILQAAWINMTNYLFVMKRDKSGKIIE